MNLNPVHSYFSIFQIQEHSQPVQCALTGKLPSFFYYETQLLRVNVNTKTKQETKEMSAKNILNFNVGVLGHVDRYIL